MGSVFDTRQLKQFRLAPGANNSAETDKIRIEGNEDVTVGILSKAQAVTHQLRGSMEPGAYEPEVFDLQSQSGTSNADELNVLTVPKGVQWLSVEVTAGGTAPSEVIIFVNAARPA